MPEIKLNIQDGTFSIHRLPPSAAIPKSVLSGTFFSLSRTADELSIVAPENVDIPGAVTNPGWVCIQVIGPLPFELVGVLAGLSTALANAKISLFAISTHETDYLLVKKENLKPARQALSAAGYKFTRAKKSQSKKSAGAVAAALLEKQLPLIHDLLVEKIGKTALSAIRSEAALSLAIGSIYEFLPTGIRLVVQRDAFVHFCVSNLDKILPPIPSTKKTTK